MAEKGRKKCDVSLKLDHNAKCHLVLAWLYLFTRQNTNLGQVSRLNGILVQLLPSVQMRKLGWETRLLPSSF